MQLQESLRCWTSLGLELVGDGIPRPWPSQLLEVVHLAQLVADCMLEVNHRNRFCCCVDVPHSNWVGGRIRLGEWHELLSSSSRKRRNPCKLRRTSPGRFGLAPLSEIRVGCDAAGATPFVVAGIEFSKRIAAQQKCAVCGGSGLVKKGGSYFRCGNCGGFLPWYSWKRFFKG